MLKRVFQSSLKQSKLTAGATKETVESMLAFKCEVVRELDTRRTMARAENNSRASRLSVGKYRQARRRVPCTDYDHRADFPGTCLTATRDCIVH